MSKGKIGIPAVGISSLLVIFAVLCLTVFSLISLSSVLAYGRINDAALKAVSDYYRADTEAENIYAAVREGDIPEEAVFEDNILSFSCDISETNVLEVSLEADGGAWRIIRWQAVPKEMVYEIKEEFWDGTSNIGG